MTLPEIHRQNTENAIKLLNKDLIFLWILQNGYFPEQYVLPPIFSSENFGLNGLAYFTVTSKERNEQISYNFNIEKKEIITIGFPKSQYTDRIFGIIDPKIFHDLVFYIIKDWNTILKHIFNKRNLIYSYSFPIPTEQPFSLRSGRMIYEYIKAFEEDLVSESHKYKFVLHIDIKNFYPSIYTHCLPWILHTKEKSRKDKQRKLLGNKIDKLLQYANDACTNGIAIGSVVSDLIAEIILTGIDKNLSIYLKKHKINFLGTRYKDDYRILINNEEDGKYILKTLAKELKEINLSINEEKTSIKPSSIGLFRKRRMEYDLISPRYIKEINFGKFRNLYQHIIDIYEKYGENGMIDRFISDLYIYQEKEDTAKQYYLKLHGLNSKEIGIICSLLINLKKLREKSLPGILAIFELLIEKYPEHKELIVSYVENIYKQLIDENIYDQLWLDYFIKIHGITTITLKPSSNLLIKQVNSNNQEIFNSSGINLHKDINTIDQKLINYLNPFLSNI